MLSPEILLSRIQTAETYLHLIDEPLVGHWSDLCETALIRRDVLTALALVHPQHWVDVADTEKVLGARAFRAPTLRGTQYCSAEDYWGLPCASRNNATVEIVADHAWPYSLGGPTHVGNIRWLCRRHNAAKSADVHLYPWEAPMPDWVSSHLEKIRKIRALGGLTL
jgi:hypothetical protein